jgi:hypothetical protein
VDLEMNPPSIATLVLASKYIRQLPSKELSKERLISEMIQNADKLLPLGYALSVMILGVKDFNKLENINLTNFYKKRKTKGYVLAEKINNADIKTVLSTFFKILEAMNLTDFFQLTTFLIELNMTKPTKKVVN